MSPEQARIVAVALVVLTALLVGFQGASTLVTVTQLGASPQKSSPARSHASLVPQPPVPVIKPPEQKAREPAPTISAGEEAPAAAAQQPAAPQPAQQPTQIVADDQSGVAAAAKAKAQAEMDTMGPQLDQDLPPRPEPRRHRAPRPELHKVY